MCALGVLLLFQTLLPDAAADAAVVRAYATVAKPAAAAAAAPTVSVHAGVPPAGAGAGAAAWAAYTATYDAIGWDVLNVTTTDSKTADVVDSMYAAGYLEGYLTQKAMYILRMYSL